MENPLPLLAYSAIIAISALSLSSCATSTPEVTETPSVPAQSTIARVSKPEKQKPNTNAMIWRFIGPMTGNRGSAVVGHPTDTNVFYHGASNGLWKTPDAGQTWIPLGDDYFKTSSVGAVEISQSNPDIIYVGMGNVAVLLCDQRA